MTGSRDSGQKGAIVEECLREYFLEAGYFVARGVPLIHDTCDVTDIDLWLYLRSSGLHRVRTNVDIKSGQRSKAFERVLWAKGVQTLLGLDDAIVATPDKRPSVKEFGAKHGVKVLDGHFLDRLGGKFGGARLSDEGFARVLDDQGLDRMRGGWKDRVRNSKSKLITSLDFQGCNFWLAEAKYFLNRFASRDRETTALRAAYVILSYLHIGLDFRYQRFAFESEDVRQRVLLQGFSYGEHEAKEVHAILREVSPELSRELGSSSILGRESILAQFYSSTRLANRLFDIARRFEDAAFSENLIWPDSLESELKSVLGVVSDYCQLDRRLILRTGSTPPQQS